MIITMFCGPKLLRYIYQSWQIQILNELPAAKELDKYIEAPNLTINGDIKLSTYHPLTNDIELPRKQREEFRVARFLSSS